MQKDNMPKSDKEHSMQNQSQDRDSRLREHQNLSADVAVDKLLREIVDSEQTGRISTGFERLDACLGGGLYNGLYILGAPSSLGKTSFCLQMADHMAEQGVDILYFSLEMSSSELVSKSISRIANCLIDDHRLQRTWKNATVKTQADIQDGFRYSRYNMDDINLINTAVAKYRKFSNRIYIKSGVAGFNVQNVCDLVNEHIDLYGRKPVVYVDYLQILAPDPELKNNDIRAQVENSIMALKRLTWPENAGTPVVAISSFNRTATGKDKNGHQIKLSEDAYKETNNIEYTADCLIGLNYTAVEDAVTGDAIDAASQKYETERHIQALIMKQRKGQTGCRINFRYDTKKGLFTEDGVGPGPAQKEVDEYNSRMKKKPNLLDRNGQTLAQILGVNNEVFPDPTDNPVLSEDIDPCNKNDVVQQRNSKDKNLLKTDQLKEIYDHELFMQDLHEGDCWENGDPVVPGVNRLNQICYCGWCGEARRYIEDGTTDPKLGGWSPSYPLLRVRKCACEREMDRIEADEEE